jgi:hypothetical protein
VHHNPSENLSKSPIHWSPLQNYRIRNSGVGFRHLYFYVSQSDAEYYRDLESCSTLPYNSVKFIILQNASWPIVLHNNNFTFSHSYLSLQMNFLGILYPSLNTSFLEVLGFELRAYTLSHSTSSIFGMGFSKRGSCKLFAQAGFEPPSSWYLPP